MQDFIKDTIVRLAQNQVEFIVVGGMSAVLHGSTHVTLDLDICYRRTPANTARLAAALAPLNPQARGLPPGLPFVLDARALQLGSNFTLVIGSESLDLLGDMAAIGGYEQVIKQAEDMEVAGYSVKVLSLAQLIATKEAAGRPKDLRVLPELKALLELKQAQQPPPSAGRPPEAP